ncbi:hypothetical protein ACFQ0B_78985 [Nonomuraea thailandensis]
MLTDLAAIRYPMPVVTEHDESTSEAFDAAAAGVEEARAAFVESLDAAWNAHGPGFDPLLTTIEDLVAIKKDADTQIRLLLAYGRAYVAPRPYTLESLGQAADLSPSGASRAFEPTRSSRSAIARACARPPPRSRTTTAPIAGLARPAAPAAPGVAATATTPALTHPNTPSPTSPAPAGPAVTTTSPATSPRDPGAEPPPRWQPRPPGLSKAEPATMSRRSAPGQQVTCRVPG